MDQAIKLPEVVIISVCHTPGGSIAGIIQSCLTKFSVSFILTTMVVNILENLSSLGLSEYEGKAYMALLKNGEALSAYEIAKIAALPSSKIYGLLPKLEEKGLIFGVDDRGKKKYSAADPDEFLRLYRLELDESISSVRRELDAVKGNIQPPAFLNFRDYETFLGRALLMIRESTKTLLISSWKEELSFIEKDLEDACKRGVKISVVHFGKPDTDSRRASNLLVFRHPIEETLYRERGGRSFAIVSDSRETILATIYGISAIEGAYSRNSGIVYLAGDYIKHDIYLMKIIERMDNELVCKFGENYHKLRDVYADEEEGK
jgi:sugar-specific transcriptional regulator TrmB